jgi:alkanesulfonate monooxygenase SsuD/methylene tetrahydromethanopterin reductase-like flavin-dependent oxidoreductase (luciferase family)
MSAPRRLGVALGWHVLPWPELLSLVRRAEALGYEAAFVDGDVSMLDVRTEQDTLDGWTVTVALLARTERIAVGSMRLAHHWNAARLAQAAATAERIAPGRLRFLISPGDRAIDRRFGLDFDAPAQRIDRLDETLTALRALWRGETVTQRGRYVRLDGARIRPTPPSGIPIAVAARRPRMLELVARHADVWDVNLPPLPERVREAAGLLEDACRRCRRDPDTIRRWMWIVTRTGSDAAQARAEFRRFNPWFPDLDDALVDRAVVHGSPGSCRERLAELAQELQLALPVVDLSGADAETARHTLESCAPGAGS